MAAVKTHAKIMAWRGGNGVMSIMAAENNGNQRNGVMKSSASINQWHQAWQWRINQKRLVISKAGNNNGESVSINQRKLA